MKIDIHVHVTPPEIIKDCQKIGARESYFKLLNDSPKSKLATAEDVVAELQRSGVDKAVVFGFGFKDPGLCRMVNDYVAEAVKNYPDFLIGFGIVNPNDPGVEQELDRCLDLGLNGVGEIFPDGQNFEIENPKFSTVFAGYLQERNMPVIIHSNEPVGHYYPGKTTTTPVKLNAFVESNPDLTVIFAHWGGGLFFYELMPELKEKYKNVYYDTAASPFLYDPKVYKVAQEVGVLDKILLGSDYPLLSPQRNMEEMTRSGLNPDEQSLINGLNALNLLSKFINRSGDYGKKSIS
jgi:predicted TIM-barrel fold metal-dependent hydrolase